MTDDKKIDRRKFIVGSSGALVGAATLGSDLVAIEMPEKQPATPSKPQVFRSPAGEEIPFSEAELRAHGPIRTFTGAHLSEIAFPLGGLGTGTVSLGGRGELRDWEIFNRPGKGIGLPFTFVALWTRQQGKQPLLRVIQAPPPPPYRGGRGYVREGGQGLPHFKGARFTGAYPFAEIAFEDDALPIALSLEAFNPFLPLETDDSALPVAILRYRVANRSASPVEVSLAFSMLNPIGFDGMLTTPQRDNRFPGAGQNVTKFRQDAGLSGLDMTSQKYDPDKLQFGSVTLATTHPTLTARCSWEPGDWFDSYEKWYDEFAVNGRMKDVHDVPPTVEGSSMSTTLAPYLTLKPGESKNVEFILSWYFPVRENYWSKGTPVLGAKLRNYYGTKFSDAWDVARYTATNLPRLEKGTRVFHDALFAGTAPAVLLDAVSSQMSILRTTTCILLEGKKFFAFEGSDDNAGCCPLNCTHVWNYEQALAHLFPDLERSMRETDFLVNVKEDGSMAFRTLIPTGKTLSKFKPAADGQMGCILKLYREWQLSGDDDFLRRLWPSAKRALEYAWVQWDANRDGVMEGEQHNTYDIEFYGANTMMGTLYLGALAAGEKMAVAMGDPTSAAEYRRVFDSGRAKLDRDLWRDGFYIQQVPDVPPPPVGAKPTETWYASAIDNGTFRYQYGEGCLSDQLLGQWFAEVVGLGHVLPPDHVRQTLQSIYRYNFKSSMYNHANPQRIYALNDEKGLLLCSWPHGKRPALPFVYSDEVWTGIEYQVAAHLIYEGFVMEGLAVVKGVRDRYDGQRRNPWNEIECGSHYARALSSWSLLTALSGYNYSAPEKSLKFAPRLQAKNFRCLFTTGSGWGTFKHTTDEKGSSASLQLQHGNLTLARFAFPGAHPGGKATATVGQRSVPVHIEASGAAIFDNGATLAAGETLTVHVAGAA